MTTQDAKNYLAKREIPQLFESLMTGLMYYRPDDHITYLQDCLRKIKEEGLDNVKWNIFIESRKKTPLPPIIGGGDNGRSQTPLGRDPSFITERPQSLEEKRGSPLPPIGQNWQQDDVNHPDRIKLPDCPIVLIMGGPGSGRATQAKLLVDKFPGWVHLSMGDLLRQQIFDKGSADEKWDMINSLVSKGQLAPEEMPIDMVKDAISKQTGAKGIILEGYPRTMTQVLDYDKYIGRVDLAFVLDCEEYYLQQRLLARGKQTGRVDDNINAVASRIAFFKDKTLPAIKHFDDTGKMVVVEGDRDAEEITYDLCMLFHNVFFSPKGQGQGVSQPRPPSVPRPRSTRYSRPGSKAGSRPGSGFTNVPLAVSIAVSDTGRTANMPTCPIVFVMGGPGSGKGAQCKRLAARYNGYVHISMGDCLRQEIMKNGSADDKWKMVKQLVTDGSMAPEEVTLDLLKSVVQGAKNAQGIIIDGYPRSKEQVEQFNKHVGGLTRVVLIDCEESTLRSALKARAATSGRLDDTQSAIPKRISFFKHHSLPILAYFDDQDQLSIVNGDGRSEDEIFCDIAAAVDDCVQNTGGQAPVTTEAGSSSIEAAETDCTVNMIPPITVTTADTGRVRGLPNVPILCVIGSPGSGVEKHAKELAQKLSLPHITAKSGSEIVSTLQSNGSARAIIVEGFLSNKAQVEDFNAKVGGLTGVIILDCDESYAKDNAASATNQVEVYKTETLPALGYLDGEDKVAVLDIQKSSRPLDDLCRVAERLISSVAGVRKPTNLPTDTTAPPIEVSVHDSGRRSGLGTLPIIAVLGGPNSGVDSYCKAAAENLSALHLQNHNVEGVLSSLKSSGDQKFILLEGLPKNKAEIEDFNKQVGGMAGVVVLDTSDEFCKSKGATEEALKEYKANTLPVLLHYEDLRLLELIKGDDDDTTDQLCKAIGRLLEQ